MRLTVIAVGRLREPALRTLADGYLARIRRYVRCDEIELRNPSGVARALPAGGTVVALEVDGEELTSTALAQRVDRWSRVDKGELTFLLGGADGLPDSARGLAHYRLSLSRMTLPHRLARVLLYEQLYRACTILRGEPYAREP